ELVRLVQDLDHPSYVWRAAHGATCAFRAAAWPGATAATLDGHGPADYRRPGRNRHAPDFTRVRASGRDPERAHLRGGRRLAAARLVGPAARDQEPRPHRR